MYEAIGLFLFICTAISQHRSQYSKHRRPQPLEPFQAMPYAKVGALPQPADVGRMQHHHQRKGRGKQKAMSMEVRAKKIERFLKFFRCLRNYVLAPASLGVLYSFLVHFVFSIQMISSPLDTIELVVYFYRPLHWNIFCVYETVVNYCSLKSIDTHSKFYIEYEPSEYHSLWVL